MKKEVNSYPQLRAAISLVSKTQPVSKLPEAFRMVVWELMKALTRITKLEKSLMDKKMHQVTKRMMSAEKAVKGGKKKQAVKILEKAEKKNEKLVQIDKTQRDPVIHAIEKAGKCKGKKCASKIKSVMKKGK